MGGFLKLDRREFMRLGVFMAAAGGGWAGKKAWLDPVPAFASPVEAFGKDDYQVPAEGALVWDELYRMKFAQDAIDLSHWVERKTGIPALGNISGHPFPVKKYLLAKEKAENDGVLTQKDFAAAPSFGYDEMYLVHSRSYIHKLRLLEFSRLGLLHGENVIPPGLVEYLKRACGGTYAAARIALARGVAMNINGGFHHAFADHESGFCYVNDVAIAIRKLRTLGLAHKVMIVDLDVHHGDGNAAITRDDPSVAIYDFYQEDNFPFTKIPVAYPIARMGYSGVTDSVYMDTLKATLPAAVEAEAPDLIFYLAGSDPFVGDVLGGFELTKQGLRRRDEFVLSTARAAEVPVAVLCAGGYPRQLEDIVDILSGTMAAVKGHAGA